MFRLAVLTIAIVTACGTPPLPPVQRPPDPVVAKPPPDPDAPLVPVDTIAVVKRLANGVTYYLYPDELADDTRITFAVKAGTLDEGDHQRGAAHLLVHMIYTALGRDDDPSDYEQTATSHDASMVVAVTSEDLVGEELGKIRRMAERLVIDPRTVEDALEAVGDHSDYVEDDLVPEWLGTRRELHPRVGETGHFSSLTAPVVKEFYRTWYRPSRIAIIVSGVFDKAAVVEQIEKRFGTLVEPKQEVPKRPQSFVKAQTGTVVRILDPNDDDPEIRISHRIPRRHTRGVRGFRDALIDRFVQHVFEERFTQVDEQAGILLPEIRSLDDANDMAIIEDISDPETAERVLREVERLVAHGVEPAELEAWKADPMIDEPAEVPVIDRSIVTHFVDGSPILGSPRDDFAIAQIKTITIDEVNAVIRATYAQKNRLILSSIEDVTLEQLRDADIKAHTPTPEPFRDQLAIRPLVTPKPGTIVATKTERDLTIYTLGNGARVIVRPGTNDKISVHAVGPAGWGRVGSDPSTYVINTLPLIGGLGDMTNEQMAEALRGRAVELSTSIWSRYHRVTIRGQGKRLETMMQGMHLVLAQAKKDPASFDEWKRFNKSAYPAAEQAWLEATARLDPVEGDYAPMYPTEVEIDSYDFDRGYAQFQSYFGDMTTTTFAVTGRGLDQAVVKAYIEKYLASIPSTGTRPADKERAVAPPKAPKVATIDSRQHGHGLTLDYAGDRVAKNLHEEERDLSIYAWAVEAMIERRFHASVDVDAAISVDRKRYARVQITSLDPLPPTFDKDVQAAIESLRTTVEPVLINEIRMRHNRDADYHWLYELNRSVGHRLDPVATLISDTTLITARMTADVITAAAKKFGKPAATLWIRRP